MTDLNWCTYCDNAITENSDSLYCSEKCLRQDALQKDLSLGYKFLKCKQFPKPLHKPDVSNIVTKPIALLKNDANRQSLDTESSKFYIKPVKLEQTSRIDNSNHYLFKRY
ncbi:uncharacterized protein BX663DRAFT_494506 [Cokeromyces recurvatus]|uniref:uncharacterized protein n=1 Tax=Cokeromyces recurvatus TaxID=90255 RepID=UPI00222001C4|nr:uncharacterized protein BX663DRAFT_494506 [Cokeromyces recurvatus]KAI7907013.1 hypothetical protein BX663DRAFT_494506 [Cokeromyces recurvatus]